MSSAARLKSSWQSNAKGRDSKHFLALNDMAVIVLSVFVLLAIIPAAIFGTLVAFHVYDGHSAQENLDFVAALYQYTFGVFTSWTFTLPVFRFNLFDLHLDFGFFWDWQLELPVDLLDAAEAFNLWSFFGALVKIFITYANAGVHTVLNACLRAYSMSGAANISLGDRARQQADSDYFLNSQTYEENVAWFRTQYGVDSLLVQSDGTVQIKVDSDTYRFKFNATPSAIAKAFPTITSLDLSGLIYVKGGECVCCGKVALVSCMPCHKISIPHPGMFPRMMYTHAHTRTRALLRMHTHIPNLSLGVLTPKQFVQLLEGDAKLNLSGCGEIALPSGVEIDNAGPDVTGRLEAITVVDLTKENVGFTVAGTYLYIHRHTRAHPQHTRTLRPW